MELVRLTHEQYAAAFPATLTPYGSTAFNLLNADKAEDLSCAALRDTSGRYRLGVILGLRDGVWRSPFSAPFGEITSNGRQKLETLAEFADMLKQRYGRLQFVLPPAFYDPVMQPRAAGSLAAAGHTDYADFNYHYELSDFAEFNSHLDANARNKLNRALRCDFAFEACGLDAAYEVIAENRSEKGYPLRMTLDQLRDTAKLIAVDSFMLSLKGASAAAAIVYRLSGRVAQVIYWGHRQEYSGSHPMNLLSREVFGFYAAAGFDIVDVGPASSDGVPDMGLCAFKESLGCRLTFKPAINLQNSQESVNFAAL